LGWNLEYHNLSLCFVVTRGITGLVVEDLRMWLSRTKTEARFRRPIPSSWFNIIKALLLITSPWVSLLTQSQGRNWFYHLFVPGAGYDGDFSG
jgi:hypothetical protein